MSVNVKPLLENINPRRQLLHFKKNENVPSTKIITNVFKSSKFSKPKFQPSHPLNSVDENCDDVKIKTKLTFDMDDVIMKPSNPQIKNDSENLRNYLTNISLQKTHSFPNDEYRSIFTNIVRQDYSSSIIASLLNDEQQTLNFLSKHKITEKMRTRMVDWMIEVLSNYHCEENSFFEAINIMDRYFASAESSLLPDELHLIGVTSMFMASKYHDIYPLRLKTVQEKIAHGKLSSEEIKNKEEEIERSLNYSIGKPSIWDFINLFIEEIFFCDLNKHYVTCQTLIDNYYIENGNSNNYNDKEFFNALYTKNMINLLKYVCIYLAKMNYHDYVLSQKKPSLLAAATIFVALKIAEQINKETYINEFISTKLSALSGKSDVDIIKTAQKILYNAQNFDSLYQGLDNLKKVHFNAIIELKVTK